MDSGFRHTCWNIQKMPKNSSSLTVNDCKDVLYFEWSCNFTPQNTVPYCIFRAPKIFCPLVGAWYCCFWLINIFSGVPCKRVAPVSESDVPISLICGTLVVYKQFNVYRGQLGVSVSNDWVFAMSFDLFCSDGHSRLVRLSSPKRACSFGSQTCFVFFQV